MIEDDQRLAEAIRAPSELIYQARQLWHAEPLIKKVIETKIDFEIETLRNTLETAKPEDVLQLQGKIAGLRTAKGISKQQAKI